MNLKAWIEVKGPLFSYFPPIQYLVVVEICAKPVITPTYPNFEIPLKSCDIRFISQMRKEPFSG
jgi:hypothetical protein